MTADERVLQFLVNLSAAVAHIFGTENERPVNAWAWRLGSRSMQYAGMGIFIALPICLATGYAFGQVWAYSWLGCWAAQGVLVARRYLGAFRQARRGGETM